MSEIDTMTDRQIDTIGEARAIALAARADVLATISELRHRISPVVMAAETVESALATAHSVVDDARKGARARPWLVALGLTLIGIAIAARARLRGESDEGDIFEETEGETDG